MQMFYDLNKIATKLDVKGAALSNPAELKAVMREAVTELNAVMEREAHNFGALRGVLTAMERGKRFEPQG